MGEYKIVKCLKVLENVKKYQRNSNNVKKSKKCFKKYKEKYKNDRKYKKENIKFVKEDASLYATRYLFNRTLRLIFVKNVAPSKIRQHKFIGSIFFLYLKKMNV